MRELRPSIFCLRHCSELHTTHTANQIPQGEVHRSQAPRSILRHAIFTVTWRSFPRPVRTVLKTSRVGEVEIHTPKGHLALRAQASP